MTSLPFLCYSTTKWLKNQSEECQQVDNAIKHLFIPYCGKQLHVNYPSDVFKIYFLEKLFSTCLDGALKNALKI